MHIEQMFNKGERAAHVSQGACMTAGMTSTERQTIHQAYCYSQHVYGMQPSPSAILLGNPHN